MLSNFSMADNSAAIAAIETILNSGVDSTTVDGLSVRHDLQMLRKRLAELKATDDTTLAAGTSRPARATIKTNYY